ncbi:hypothetical protein D4Q85_00590 [bacterium]|nr:MAG: hypothetical protein D4Q85_00590 [bacterium]
MTLGDVEIDSAGTVTLGDALRCGPFTFTAGTLNDAGYNLYVNGDLNFTNGTLVSSGEWHHTGSGDVYGSNSNVRPALLVLGDGAGVTSTLQESVNCKTFAYGVGTVTGGGYDLYLYPQANDFWTDGAGTIDGLGRIRIYIVASLTQTGPITVADKLSIAQKVGFTLGISGAVNAGSNDIEVGATTATTGGLVTFSGGLTTTGALKLGYYNASGYGGNVALACNASLGAIETLQASNPNALALSPNHILRLTGTLDGTDIAVTSAEADVHDGILKDVGGTGIIRRWGAVADTGCTLDLVHYPSPLGPAVALVAA